MNESKPLPDAPVLLLGLDAAEIDVIERMVASEDLPNLAKLWASSHTGRLQTDPMDFLSIVWTTAFTSTSLGNHGWYFNKQWNPEKQCLQWPDTRWLPRKPFWESFNGAVKAALLDVPYAVDVPSDKQHMAIGGWQNHDDFGSVSQPTFLWKELEDKYGKPLMTPEFFGKQSKDSLLAAYLELKNLSPQFAKVVCELMSNHERDLVFAVYGGLHRATHYLWDTSQIDEQNSFSGQYEALNTPLESSYKVMDDMIGELLANIPETTRIFLFSLHGMGPNHGWYEYLPQIVGRIHAGENSVNSGSSNHGLIYKLKKKTPFEMVRGITRIIPSKWNQALVPLWSRSMHPWEKTRYFTIPMDYNGYIRLNIEGRDKLGCVPAGAVDDTIAEIEAALTSFRDIRSGKPIIAGVQRVEDLIDATDNVRAVLPDLVVTWAVDFPTALSSGVVSDAYGEITWPLGQKLYSGRSGNHTPNGWFLARGPGIEATADDFSYRTVDIAPTIFNWLRQPQPPEFEGEVIEPLRLFRP